ALLEHRPSIKALFAERLRSHGLPPVSARQCSGSSLFARRGHRTGDDGHSFTTSRWDMCDVALDVDQLQATGDKLPGIGCRQLSHVDHYTLLPLRRFEQGNVVNGQDKVSAHLHLLPVVLVSICEQ